MNYEIVHFRNFIVIELEDEKISAAPPDIPHRLLLILKGSICMTVVSCCVMLIIGLMCLND